MLKEKKFLIFLIFSSLLWGALWGISSSPPTLGGDSWTYHTTAIAIRHRGLFEGFREVNNYIYRPLYPIALALFYTFGENISVAIFFQILLVAATAVLLYFLSRKLFTELTAKISCIIFFFFIPSWAYSGILMREVMETFLLLCIVFLLYQTAKKPTTPLFLLIGILLGANTLLNGIMYLLIFPVLVFSVYLLHNKIPVKKLLLNSSLLLASFFAASFGWLWLVQKEIGSPKFTGDTLGLYLMERSDRMQTIQNRFPLYFTAHFLGDYFASKLDPAYDSNSIRLGHRSREIYAELVKTNTVAEAEKIFIKTALAQISKHPILFAEQTLLEALKFNTPLVPVKSLQPVFDKTHPEIPGALKIIFLAGFRLLYYAFLAIVFISLYKNRKNLEQFGWIILVILYFQLVYIFIYAIPRYALPLYPLYSIVFAVWLSEHPKISKLFLRKKLP